MSEITNISFLISTRNSCERLKIVYYNIRSFYKENYIVFISDNSTDDTHDFLSNLQKTDDKIILHLSDTRLNFAGAYNKAIELCPTNLFCFFHDDTFVSENFLENLVKNLKENNTFACFSTCEPPIFHSSDSIGKPIKNFGTDYKTLKLDEFYKFSKDFCNKNNKTISYGGGFFMCGPIEEVRKLNGFDPLFYPHFSEDSDLIHKLILNGNKFVLVLDSLVYHLPSSTSKFSDEFKNKKLDFGIRNFLRKWHVPWPVIQAFNNDNVSYKKSRCKLILNSSNIKLLYHLEPFFDTIVTNSSDLISQYIEKEQLNTRFILKDKFIENGPYDFICYINENQNINVDYISKLQYIVKDAEKGQYKIEDLVIELT